MSSLQYIVSLAAFNSVIEFSPANAVSAVRAPVPGALLDLRAVPDRAVRELNRINAPARRRPVASVGGKKIVEVDILTGGFDGDDQMAVDTRQHDVG